MKTLFIEYSYLTGNGGGIYAARAHVNLFARLSSYMTLVYPSNSDDDIEGINTDEIDELCAIKDTRSFTKKVIDRLNGWFTRYSLLDDALFAPDKYDVVVFDNSVVSAHLIELAKSRGLRVITIHHNYQVEYLKADGKPLEIPLDLFWTKKHEGKAISLSDINIVLTPQDAELLSKHYNDKAPFRVLGVCEYNSKVKKEITPREKTHKYIITGGLSSRQNEQSIIRWLEHYFPLLKEVDTEAELTIAGRRPSKKLASFIQSQGARVIDSPVEMQPLLNDSDFYICPVDRGGGLKLKIMDGLKAGLPVITHRVSARGYEPMAEYGVLFGYEDEQTFKAAIVRALNCTKTRDEIIDHYNSVFSFECGLSRLESILREENFL